MTHDWRLAPLALATWGAAWLGSSGWRPEREAVIAAFVGLLLLAVVAARGRRAWTAMIIAAFTVTLLMSGVQSWQRHASPVAELAAEGAIGTVRLKLLAEAQPAEGVVIGHAELIWAEARRKRVESRVPVVILASGAVSQELLGLTAGATYEVRARLRAPEPDDAAGAVLSLREIGSEVTGPGIVDRAVNAMRQGLRDAVAHSPPRQAALVPSLVVGDTSAVDAAMRDEFQVTALTHLMAVSGANLTLMLSVVLAAVRGLGLRGWSVRVAALGGVVAFVLICGQEPSVYRAAVMGLVALAAIGVGAGRRTIRSLCVAVLILVWLDPWMARSIGFALSASACAGIVLLGPLFVAAISRWAPRWAAEALAVPLAAQLATQPIITALSDQVSVVGVLTNVLAGPFVGPTTVLGFAGALLCPLPWLAAGPGWLAGWCAQPILWLAEFGSALPTASWTWKGSALGVALVTLGSAALAVVLLRALRHRWGGVGFISLFVALALVRPVPLGWPGEWQAVFCDVGQGDATVLNASGGAAVVIDAGPEPSATVSCLESLRVEAVPLLILTHYHADHVGGAEALIARYRPSLVLVRSGPHPPWLEDIARETGTEVRSATPGEVLEVGDVTWRTASVWEPAGAAVAEAEGEGSAENDASVVGVGSSGSLRVLLAGDAEPAGQGVALRAAAQLGVDLEAHVLKLPHHGSSRQEPRFFAASGAALAVASAGEGNSYGHPSVGAMDLARSHGMEIVRTDTQGSIAVALGGEKLTIRTAGGAG
ncbi:ComEC/Rec2 family competence protein [Tessaracoccus sp. MC1865]|uniref:ComEC/Rec2 family competence protein n=1 Tax=Tessaracoccus sp. MC1865 TaxID=2760310 RepID=UPI0016003DAC|nr:ComEC/Rec2 family competence protein [Tessaracoccus sp. MC1865]MBB1484802.1 ComEC/Rec2 family competence protein [Tessaracoccus sp. MC1865]QTO38795.1 ComEC/Rec2 family competence protein [Tessaracoccus sp. MC1865]